MEQTKVLILGTSGMLGHTLFHAMMQNEKLSVFGTVRSKNKLLSFFPEEYLERIVEGLDVTTSTRLKETICEENRPDIVINCVGMIRQQENGNDPQTCIELNSRLPHLLHNFSTSIGAKLIHISTDCVFSGKDIVFNEKTPPTAHDVYGMSKFLGEVSTPPSLTIRTSIIGHELRAKRSLLEWFLARESSVEGYVNAIYSGMPTIVLADLIMDIIANHRGLHGLYQVSSDPISKYDLLRLIADEYGKKISISASTKGESKILSYSKFTRETGYRPLPWDQMIKMMHEDHLSFLSLAANR